LLFVTSTPEIDVRMFKMVVKSKMAAIARVLNSATQAEPAERPADSTEPDDVQVIVNTLNAFSTDIARSVGRSRLAELWRQAKKAKVGTWSVLEQYQIDPNGHWVLRKGLEPPSLREICRPLAEVTGHLLGLLGPEISRGNEALKTVISAERESLAQTGFLHYLRAATAPSATHTSESSS
jgi:hypothetical protein